MEIATEIIKICDDYEHKIKNFIDSVKAFKLGLLSESNSLTFMKSVKTSNIESKIDTMSNNIFITKRKIGTTLITAYMIVAYTDDMFDSYKTSLENRLIKAAFNLVYMIEHGDTSKYRSFAELFDHYNCLYDLWIRGTDVQTLDNLMENVTDLIQLYNISKKQQYVDQIINILDSLIHVDKLLGVKVIFNSYCKLCDIPEVYDKVWHIITDQLSTDLEQTVLILLAELRIRILTVSNNPRYKKELYYGVDFEDTVCKIQSNRLSLSDYNKMFALFCNCLQIKPLKIKSINKDVVRCLKKLYDKTCTCDYS